MAVTITLYNHTVSRFVDGLNADSDTYTINLYSAMTPDVTHTTMAAVNAAATQLTTQYGYTQGAKDLTGVAITLATTNDAKFDADDVTWTASGGAIGPASHAVIFNNTDTDDPPLCYIAFGENKTADNGTDFKIVFNSSGIVTFTYT